jgi:hypothetical protein
MKDVFYYLLILALAAILGCLLYVALVQHNDPELVSLRREIEILSQDIDRLWLYIRQLFDQLAGCWPR